MGCWNCGGPGVRCCEFAADTEPREPWVRPYVDAFEEFLRTRTPREALEARERMLILLPADVHRWQADRIAARISAEAA